MILSVVCPCVGFSINQELDYCSYLELGTYMEFWVSVFFNQLTIYLNSLFILFQLLKLVPEGSNKPNIASLGEAESASDLWVLYWWSKIAIRRYPAIYTLWFAWNDDYTLMSEFKVHHSLNYSNFLYSGGYLWFTRGTWQISVHHPLISSCDYIWAEWSFHGRYRGWWTTLKTCESFF